MFYSCLRPETMVFMQQVCYRNTIGAMPSAALNSIFSGPLVCQYLCHSPLITPSLGALTFSVSITYQNMDAGYREQGKMERKAQLWKEKEVIKRKTKSAFAVSPPRLISDSCDKFCSLQPLSSATAGHNTVITIRGVISKLQRTAQQRKL